MEKKVNYFAIILAIVSIISIFLPWAELSSSISYGGYSSSYSSGGISGISIPGVGIFGLIVALVGLFMVLLKVKWSFIAGIINVLHGLSYMLGWFGSSGFVDIFDGTSSGSLSGGVDPQYGLIIFVVASVLFVITTLKYLKASNLQTQENNPNLNNLTNDLKKIKDLLEGGIINNEQYEKMKLDIVQKFENATIENSKEGNLFLNDKDLSDTEKVTVQNLIKEMDNGDVIAKHGVNKKIELMPFSHYQNWIKTYGIHMQILIAKKN